MVIEDKNTRDLLIQNCNSLEIVAKRHKQKKGCQEYYDGIMCAISLIRYSHGLSNERLKEAFKEGQINEETMANLWRTDENDDMKDKNVILKTDETTELGLDEEIKREVEHFKAIRGIQSNNKLKIKPFEIEKGIIVELDARIKIKKIKVN